MPFCSGFVGAARISHLCQTELERSFPRSTEPLQLLNIRLTYCCSKSQNVEVAGEDSLRISSRLEPQFNEFLCKMHNEELAGFYQ